MISLVRIDNGQQFMTAVSKVSNDDGSVSFKLPNDTFGGQEPNIYGKRNDNHYAGPYQRFRQINDTVVIVQTRDHDIPFMYVLCEGVVYPS